MLSILLSLFYQCSVLLILLAASSAGILWSVAVFSITSQRFAIYAKQMDKLAGFFCRTALIAAAVCCVIAILHLLTGGGINAL
jgi:hypothetical protein